MNLSKAAKDLMSIFDSYLAHGGGYACDLSLREIKSLLYKTQSVDVTLDKLQDEVLQELFNNRLCFRAVKESDKNSFDPKFIKPSEDYTYVFISPELDTFYKGVTEAVKDGLFNEMIRQVFRPVADVNCFGIVKIERQNFDRIQLTIEFGYVDDNQMEHLLSDVTAILTTSWAQESFFCHESPEMRTQALLGYLNGAAEALKTTMLRRYDFMQKTFKNVLERDSEVVH